MTTQRKWIQILEIGCSILIVNIIYAIRKEVYENIENFVNYVGKKKSASSLDEKSSNINLDTPKLASLPDDSSTINARALFNRRKLCKHTHVQQKTN